jgi:hypothetical protein
MIEQTDNLTNHFLIAMPGMADPFFAKTVTYLCQHGREGALGIIVNRPSELTLGDIVQQMGIEISAADVSGMPIYFGGPVQPERLCTPRTLRALGFHAASGPHNFPDHIAGHSRSHQCRQRPAQSLGGLGLRGLGARAVGARNGR